MGNEVKVDIKVNDNYLSGYIKGIMKMIFLMGLTPDMASYLLSTSENETDKIIAKKLSSEIQ